MTATRVTKETTCCETIPKVNAAPARIRENSLICVRETPVKKEVLAPYPAMRESKNTNTGFAIKTKRENTSAGSNNGPSAGRASCSPNATKKMVAKKSLKDFTLPAISKSKGDDASEIPAKNAPMATEKPSKSETSENTNSQETAYKNSISWDFAADLKMGGSTNRLHTIAREKSPMPFKAELKRT